MNKFLVKVKGMSPYLQHRMDDLSLEKWEKNRGPIMERKELSSTDEKRAEYHSYNNDNGNYYIPGDHFKGALISAGTFLKAKVGGRSKSMKTIVAAAFTVATDQIPIPKFDSIDKRSAVNRAVKARVVVIRPRWNNWEAEFELYVREDTITKETITELINYAGGYVGIGSFRPTNNGSFGTFELVSLTPIH